jgi:methionine sulfoxide reductase catalytic subunit
MVKIKSSEITPEHVYLSRRKFMVGVGALALSAAALSACGVGQVQPTSPPKAEQPAEGASTVTAPTPTVPASSPSESKITNTTGEKLTSASDISGYINYYEFTVAKDKVANDARNFKSSPWTVQVGGLVNKPMTYDMGDLLKRFQQEERVYRLRCVEGWSMVIPWTGFPLASLLKEVDPKSSAKFVRFESVLAPDQMPGQRDSYFPWPYIEGLRVDEAMNDLALMVTGLYGKPLPNENGAPFRLAVPWKYGFKSAKAIVKIDLVEQMPTSLWMTAAPDEYGFYSNVNPDRPHPRWSQSSERRIGEAGRRRTLKFNGYESEVAHLYDGMDLIANY